jgi:YVTN family beta-propeller protein
LKVATDFVDGVIVVDTTDHTVSTTIPLANSPHGIAVKPATNTLYVTQLDSDTVTVIDADSLGVVSHVSVTSATAAEISGSRQRQ